MKERRTGTEMPRLTVLLLHSHFSPALGGQERRMQMLAKELVRQGHQVFVAVPQGGADDADQWAARGTTIVEHPVMHTGRALALADPILYEARLRRFFQSGALPDPDLILSFHYCYTVAAKRVWTRSRVLFLCGAAQLDWLTSLHGHRGTIAPILSMLKGPAMRYMERRAVTRADGVLAESEFLRRRLIAFHGAEAARTAIAPAPLDINRFRAGPEIRRRVRSEMGIRDDVALILAVGRLDANKNYQTLIRAVAELPGPGWHLAIAGSGPEESNLQRLISALSLEEHVSLLGHCGRIEEIYAAADIFAHPSLLESYGNVTLEAMACRLPSVISSGPKVGIAADLKHETNALLADPMNVPEWAAALERLIGNSALRARLGAQARDFCERRPSWSDFALALTEEPTPCRS